MSKINKLKNQVENETVTFSKEYLTETNPLSIIVEGETTSSKYDKEREEKIGKGIDLIKEKFPNINPLTILLGLFWEHKTARAEVKKMIDAEAEEKGFDKNQYLQEVLREDVESLSDFSEAINRLKYAINYYKPRNPQNYKVPTKQVRVGDDLYEIAIKDFEEARTTTKSAKQLKAYVIENGKKIEGIETL